MRIGATRHDRPSAAEPAGARYLIPGMGAAALILGLSACAAGPAAFGITGPAPVYPPEERRELEAGTGVVFDPNRPGGSTGGRFWRGD